MKKMLYILNIANRVNNFSYTSMKAAQELGFDYHIAGNWSYANDQERMEDEKKYGIHIYQIDFIRTPYHPGNIKAYKQLKDIVEREKFDVIHCNTPIGGVVGRLLGKSCKVPTVIYQAHGFHFYKGAPVLNWIIYYPIERWLAYYTDALITINQEDYQRAQSFRLRNQGKVYYVPGVGIDVEQYKPSERIRSEKRQELGLDDDTIMLLSAGDLVERKNYSTSIKAIAKAKDRRLQYYICGKGPEEEQLRNLAKEIGVSDRVHFLGFRSDIRELMNAADIFVFSTLQEGLPRSLSEAMAAGLPSVSSAVRGNTDLIDNSGAGILCVPTEDASFAEAIERLANDRQLREKMKAASRKQIQSFDVKASEKALLEVYRKELGGGGVILPPELLYLAYKRQELGIHSQMFTMIAVGDLNKNKNIRVIIQAMSLLSNENVQLVLCGIGEEENNLKELSKTLKIQSRVHFLGFRNDIIEILRISDLYIMASFREGLSRSIMEAMACGLPCIVSDIRGNRDLIDESGGCLCNPKSAEEYSVSINEVIRDNKRVLHMRQRNVKKVSDFSTEAAKMKLKEIYVNTILDKL